MGNVNENRLNLTYSAADIALMKANANSTISKVPAGATLTPEERGVNQNDIDVDNKIFVEDVVYELNFNGASIMPSWLIIPQIATDLSFFEQSDELETIYENLLLRINDAKRIAGREAMAGALRAYHQYREAAENGVPGAQASYDKLKVRFEKMASSKPKQTP